MRLADGDLDSSEELVRQVLAVEPDASEVRNLDV